MKLSPLQSLILTAAANVDHIGFETGSNIPHGVFRSLVIHGLLRHHPHGYEITDMGRAKAPPIARMKEDAA